MRPTMIAVLLLAGCGVHESQVAPEATAPISSGKADASDSGAGSTTVAATATWRVDSNGEGVALVVVDEAGTAALRLFCEAGRGTLLVNVPHFEPVGSEDRLSFGHGGRVEALVADPSGDAARGGVTAAGPVPDNLAALLSGAVSVSYGAQVSGPHPVPQADLVNGFTSACSEHGSVRNGTAPRQSTDTASPALSGAGACQTQDGHAIPANPLRAFGTEPFWGARVDGRCVTYTHPENQKGTRVWTRFSGAVSDGTWSGALDGQPFLMRTRAQAGCSDGMSDNRYPIAVTLTVGGEQRSGCAERK